MFGWQPEAEIKQRIGPIGVGLGRGVGLGVGQVAKADIQDSNSIADLRACGSVLIPFFQAPAGIGVSQFRLGCIGSLDGSAVFVAKGDLRSNIDGVPAAALAEKKNRLWPPFLRQGFFFAIILILHGE